MTSIFRIALLSSLVATSLSCTSATSPTTTPVAVRLVDLFDAKRVQGSARPAAAVPPTIWRFDGGAAFAAAGEVCGDTGVGARPWNRRSGDQGWSADRAHDRRRRAHPCRADDRTRCPGHAARDRGPNARVRWGEPLDPDVKRADCQPRRDVRHGTTAAMAAAVPYPGRRRVPDLRADAAPAHRDLAHPSHRDPAH